MSSKDSRTIVVSKDEASSESSEDLERGEQINLDDFDLVKLDLLTQNRLTLSKKHDIMMQDRTSSISATAQKRRVMSKSLAEKKDLRMQKLMKSDSKHARGCSLLPKSNSTVSDAESLVSSFNDPKPRRQPSQKPQRAVTRQQTMRFKSDKKKSTILEDKENDSNGLQTVNSVDKNFIELRKQRYERKLRQHKIKQLVNGSANDEDEQLLVRAKAMESLMQIA